MRLDLDDVALHGAGTMTDRVPGILRICVPFSCLKFEISSFFFVQIVSMEIVLRPITPYLLPMLLLSYPLVRMSLVVKAMDQERHLKCS